MPLAGDAAQVLLVRILYSFVVFAAGVAAARMSRTAYGVAPQPTLDASRASMDLYPSTDLSESCPSVPGTIDLVISSPCAQLAGVEYNLTVRKLGKWRNHPDDDVTSRIIKETGTYEPMHTRHVCRALHSTRDRGPGHALRRPRMVDVGVNVGWYTMLGAMLGADVTSFEPNPHSRAIVARSLCLNARRLRPDAVRLMPFGAASTSQTCYLFQPIKNVGNTFVRCGGTLQERLNELNAWGRSQGGKGVRFKSAGEVKLRRVDEFVAPPIDVFKIDIEGNEQNALDGFAPLFPTMMATRGRAAAGPSAEPAGTTRPRGMPLLGLQPALVLSEFWPRYSASLGLNPADYLLFFVRARVGSIVDPSNPMSTE